MRLSADAQTFAAERRRVLTRGDELLGPQVLDALILWPLDGWYDDLLDGVEDYARAVAADEGAPQVDLGSLRPVLSAALEQTSEPTDPVDPAQVDRITRWLSTVAVNAGTLGAVRADPEDLFVQWVTMRDEDVRGTHRAVEGQVRPLGETFTVGGSDLHYPGEPVGPPSVWIGCRCVLRPTLAPLVSAGHPGGEVDNETDRPTPGGDMPPEQTMATDTDTDEELDPQAPPVPDEAEDVEVPWYGVLAPEGVPTGDRRQFDPGSLRYRDLPLPLRWQKVDEPGHDGSVVIGRIDHIWLEDGLHKAFGVFSRTEEAEEVVDLLAERMLRGVSVDLDDITLELRNDDGTVFDPDDFEPDGPQPLTVITDGRIASAALVSIPAFQEAFVAIGTWDDAEAEPHDPPEDFAISEDDWDGSASRFTDAQWKRSCVLDRGEEHETAKERYALPIREPNGDLSRAGVHAAASRINQVKGASDQAVAKAKAALRSAYDDLDEDPPESVAASGAPSGQVQWVDAEGNMVDQPATSTSFAPGTKDGPGWITHPRATARIRRYWVRGPGAAKIRWGQPGDFYRCRRQLRKYVKNPKWLSGLCANMHKEALGIWPGQHSTAQAPTGDPAAAFTPVACEDCVDSLVAAASPPPATWFTDPGLPGPTAVQVTEDGRIFGHIATWGTCHIGIPGVCTTAPNSASNYAYFRMGEVLTDDGPVSVGHVTMDTGHADLSLSANETLAHYDQTGLAVADVAAGEDEHGIWIAGRVREHLSEDDRAALRAAPLSGDWRSIAGSLEMVGVLAVNVPGFPVPRTAVAASGGVQTALVAPAPHAATPGPDVETLAEQVAEAIERRTARRAALATTRNRLLAAARQRVLARTAKEG